VQDIVCAGYSVNSGAAPPPVVLDEEPSSWAAVPPTGLWASMPAECIALTVGFLGVRETAQCACVSRWMHCFATADGLWVKKALDAGIDWASVPPCPPHSLHRFLGPQLHLYEANVSITLRLARIEHREDDPPDTSSNVEWPPRNYQEVTIDMRTPLSTVTEPFIEAVHSELRQQHDEREGEEEADGYREDGVFPYHPRPHYCFQGRPSRFGESPEFGRAQRINPTLTAWHYRLASGTILSFTEEPLLMD
jgi:hypothetical protein